MAWLFTARTLPSYPFSPGFGLPDNESTLSPAGNAIIPGGPEWDQIGGWSRSCGGTGCGYTGWIGSEYNFSAAGMYSIRFDVSNYGDDQFDSGLAFTDFIINKSDVAAIPEPVSWAMMLIGFGTIGGVARARVRRKIRTSLTYN